MLGLGGADRLDALAKWIARPDNPFFARTQANRIWQHLVGRGIVDPGDDFISVLASGEKKGVFTRHEVLVNTSLLLLAGHETTINLICNGTLAFLRHPEQWARLKEDPAGWAKRATEECLRYDAPVKSIQRIASEDVEMKGKVMRKQDRIRWFISSANRDPDAFPDPNRFDITRQPDRGSRAAEARSFIRCHSTVRTRLASSRRGRWTARPSRLAGGPGHCRSLWCRSSPPPSSWRSTPPRRVGPRSGPRHSVGARGR